jgi:hypothetical protein
MILLGALVAGAVVMAAPRDAFGAKGARASRRANARTGRLAPALAELVKASKRGDRAALGRLADRLGPARLGEAVASADPAVAAAALAAVPMARGGVLLVGVVANELSGSEPARVGAAASALGALLDGESPTELEDWDVPADVIERACAGLKALPARGGAPLALRLVALDAIAAAAPTCGAAPELASMARDPAPAIRRAVALVGAVGERRQPILRDAIGDGDRGVSAAGTAESCRIEGRSGRDGKTEPPSAAAISSARALAALPATPPEDAVEMLDCVAAAGTAADWALVDELQHRPPSPLRDRAVELNDLRGRR